MTAIPKAWLWDDGRGGQGTPWFLRLKLELQIAGFTEEECLSMPLGKALLEYFAIREEQEQIGLQDNDAEPIFSTTE